jgi:hypothetical protein
MAAERADLCFSIDALRDLDQNKDCHDSQRYRLGRSMLKESIDHHG